jgi:hypothetical protein
MLNHLKSKKFLGLVIFIVFLFILIPLVLIFVVNPLKQKSAGSSTQKIQTAKFAANTELATFNGTPILVSNLNALALEQYGTSNAKTLNAVSLDNLLNTYVERKILDKQNLGDVSVEAAKIQKTTGISANQAKYNALREKFTATAPKSWSIYSINFWLTPTKADGSFINGASKDNTGQTNQDRKKLVTDINSALAFAETQMQKGISVFNVATQIVKNYPSIANLLGVNGFRFNGSTTASSWSTPVAYYYDKTNATDPFYKTLYAFTQNSPATKVLNNDNMGGSVIKIVKISNPNGMLDNYNNWLKNQESGLKITNEAINKLENTR